MLYNTTLLYEENAFKGPFFKGDIPERIIPSRDQWTQIFGQDIIFPLGLFSCPFVTNARSMKLASDLGYDLITWKSIRSKPTPAHPFPNVTYVQMENDQARVSGPPASAESLALATSIGIASFDFENTMQQMEKGRAAMRAGQLFIASIYGVGETQKKMIDDFVYLALRVKEAGAQVIEANLSCPNVHQIFYEDTQLVYELSAALVAALNGTPLALKMGLFSSKKIMRETLRAAARAGAQGITAINSVSTKIVDAARNPYFGTRIKAGVSGAPILSRAIEFVREAKKIITAEQLDLTILGGGGITMPGDIDLFFDAGAEAVLSGAGALYNPYLMHEYRMKTEPYLHPTIEGYKHASQ